MTTPQPLPDLRTVPNHPSNVLEAATMEPDAPDYLLAADALRRHEDEHGIVYAGLQTYALTLAQEAVARDDPAALREAVIALLQSAARP